MSVSVSLWIFSSAKTQDAVPDERLLLQLTQCHCSARRPQRDSRTQNWNFLQFFHGFDLVAGVSPHHLSLRLCRGHPQPSQDWWEKPRVGLSLTSTLTLQCLYPVCNPFISVIKSGRPELTNRRILVETTCEHYLPLPSPASWHAASELVPWSTHFITIAASHRYLQCQGDDDSFVLTLTPRGLHLYVSSLVMKSLSSGS